MDSNKFFADKEFNGKWKKKSGIYIIECPHFTSYTGFPVFKIGYSRESLYTRISNYRTAFGLVPFKIHFLYLIPQGIRNVRPNFANLTERVLQETARNHGHYAGVGEWFRDLSFLLTASFLIRENHLEKYSQAKKWEIYPASLPDAVQRRSTRVRLVDESELSGTFKNLLVGQHNTRSSNIKGDNGDLEYEEHVKQNAKDTKIYLKKRHPGFEV